jgi:hypothetical protein
MLWPTFDESLPLPLSVSAAAAVTVNVLTSIRPESNKAIGFVNLRFFIYISSSYQDLFAVV